MIPNTVDKIADNARKPRASGDDPSAANFLNPPAG